MALTNYTELQAAVANWMHRSNLTGDVPDFITLAENRIRALLDSRLQKAVVPIDTTAGVEYMSLPSDLLHVKSLSIPTVNPRLDYMAPDVFNQNFGMGVAGAPRCYTIIGDLLYLGPTPDAVYTIMATLSSEFAPLSASSTTNTLLAKWPNVYLWGALVEAAKFCKDMEMRAQFDADFLTAMDGVNRVDWNAPGAMTVRTDLLV
jgi:hypothetical protein